MPQEAELYQSAEQQLNICNSCRYCEGYCAVFPALERYTELTTGKIDFLANVCHDCRACLYACMYAPPHEFGVDIPRTLSRVRRGTWKKDLPWPARRFAELAGAGPAAALLVCAAVVLVISGSTVGLGQLWHSHASAASPYAVVPYPAVLSVMGLAFLYGLAVMAVAARNYWRRTGAPPGGLRSLAAWRAAVADAAYLRNLRGGGGDCQYPSEAPNSLRRHLHAAVAYGFLACLLATISAGFLQDAAGDSPPYPFVSLPVLSGTLGGVAIMIGTLGLLFLKSRADPYATDEDAIGQDAAFVAALAILALTGLLTLLLRSSSAFGIVLIVHLSVVAACFVLAPSSKFAHAPYRLLALVQEHLEEPSAAVTAA
ncbi:MAG: tricarballylate utilization 4Fe-4S protein TcuB [Acidimicrobiaceae bacterium]|nr:tricarballylate utilization 4Fe-4S protein TcuB [Acidimicrobiaceae bacterium]MBO0747227.1 tricarballylate utilization 4Fe-4S protein TcuB [Acidimicrobiaceae bacterium]